MRLVKRIIEQRTGLKLQDLPEGAKHLEGKTYYCEYWQNTYTVLQVKENVPVWGTEVTCRWAANRSREAHITTHSTRLIPGKDYLVITEQPFKLDIEMSIEEMFTPMLKYVGLYRAHHFMWMGTMFQGNARIYLYKNKVTRSYLNIDEEGKFYLYDGTKSIPFREVPIEVAMGPFNSDIEDGRD